MATHRRKHPAPEALRKRIAEIIAFHGIRKAELARRIGVTPPTITQWVTGSGTPSDENARRAAGVLGEDVEFFMARSDRGGKGLGAVFGELLDKAGPEDVKFLASLPADELKRLVAAVRATRPQPKATAKKS